MVNCDISDTMSCTQYAMNVGGEEERTSSCNSEIGKGWRRKLSILGCMRRGWALIAMNDEKKTTGRKGDV